MKRIVMIAGPANARQKFTAELMGLLNPGVNEVRADVVSMDDYPGIGRAAASKSCKNALRGLHVSVRDIIVISNDSPGKNDMNPFIDIAKSLMEVKTYLIDLWDRDEPEGFDVVLESDAIKAAEAILVG